METDHIKNRLNEIGSKQPSTWLEEAKARKENELWLDKSAKIAIKILRTLRAKSMSQKDLADKLGLSAQYVNRVVKGRENLTLETICKIESILGIELISVSFFYTNTSIEEASEFTRTYSTKIEMAAAVILKRYESTQQPDSYTFEESNELEKLAA